MAALQLLALLRRGSLWVYRADDDAVLADSQLIEAEADGATSVKYELI